MKEILKNIIGMTIPNLFLLFMLFSRSINPATPLIIAVAVYVIPR